MANEFILRKGLISLGGTTYPYKAVTTTYTIGVDDQMIDCTSGTFNVTLPTAVSITGKLYTVKNSGTGTITINTTSSQTIDGSLTKALLQYQSLNIESNGTNWIVTNTSGVSGGTISLSAIGATANANGATLTGSVLNLQPASSSFGGVVTTGDQTFAGIKTFTGSQTQIVNSVPSLIFATGPSGSASGSIICSATTFQLTANSTGGYAFLNNSLAHVLDITQSGNATFLGSVTATAFYGPSDIKSKNIIERDGDTIKFTWKDKRDDKVHTGYVAQEVQEKYPDQVNEGTDGLLTVNYIEVLVAKIQELENRIKILESR